jgi:prepilin signal peptidase PulO-like enzyme (type II secretory pathway)
MRAASVVASAMPVPGCVAERSASDWSRGTAGAAALACFYLLLCLIRPDEMGLGDAKAAASIGRVLGWTD